MRSSFQKADDENKRKSFFLRAGEFATGASIIASEFAIAYIAFGKYLDRYFESF